MSLHPRVAATLMERIEADSTAFSRWDALVRCVARRHPLDERENSILQLEVFLLSVEVLRNAPASSHVHLLRGGYPRCLRGVAQPRSRYASCLAGIDARTLTRRGQMCSSCARWRNLFAVLRVIVAASLLSERPPLLRTLEAGGTSPGRVVSTQQLGLPSFLVEPD